MDTQIAQQIMELDISTRHALAKIGSRNAILLKDRILFLLRNKPQSPQTLITFLEIGKTNLALIAKTMLQDNLIAVQNTESDKRLIEYSITNLGRQKLDALLEKIQLIFKNILTTPTESQDAYNNIDKVLLLLSFL